MPKKPKKSAPLDAALNVSEAFKIILKHNLKYLDEWENTARSWEDIEGVHQIRVAFRRMRSALQVFRAVVLPEVSQEWADEMRWLAGQFGPARDLDVFLDEGLKAVSGKLPLPGEEKMLALARHHREVAYGNVVSVLDGERYRDFKKNFAAWLDAAPWRHGPLTAKQSKRLDGKIVPFARKLLDKQERLVLEAGTDVNRDVAKEMHRLRIQCKKLRYAAEFFTPLFNGMEDFIGHMKGLQDLLGIMNDVAVMQHLLEDLLADTQDSEVLQYAGGLVGWRTRQYHEIKDTFDERWEELLSAKHPWWKR